MLTDGFPARRRLSLPASLLEPVPNLEYWNYLDRPDVFAAYVFPSSIGGPSLTSLIRSINDSDDPFMRMIAVLRFTFTKDLKFIVELIIFFHVLHLLTEVL